MSDLGDIKATDPAVKALRLASPKGTVRVPIELRGKDDISDGSGVNPITGVPPLAIKTLLCTVPLWDEAGFELA